MSTQQQLYRVSANLDQLQREGMDKTFTWVPHPKVPNRVHTELPIDQARSLYGALKFKGLVALRTWLDD